jgi:hypothetical protein
LLRHLPILGRVVSLRIRPTRLRWPFCDDHPTTTQTLDWYGPNVLHIVQLINPTLTDVTEQDDVSYAALLGILDRAIAETVDWDALLAHWHSLIWEWVVRLRWAITSVSRRLATEPITLWGSCRIITVGAWMLTGESSRGRELGASGRGKPGAPTGHSGTGSNLDFVHLAAGILAR